jgi:transcriptional regulator with XRE-family HTH domain
LSKPVVTAYCSAVEQDRDWSAKIAAQVGRQIAHFRAKGFAQGKRMTAQGLADRCAELGLPLDRAVIAKLEKGLRQTITVGEVLVLAKALGVPPLLLVFPVGQQALTEALPGRAVPTWNAAKWFAGDDPLFREHHEELGIWLTDPEDADAWNRAAGIPIGMYRQHDRLLQDYGDALSQAEAARRAAGAAATQGERDAYLGRAEAEDRRLREVESRLRNDRAYMRRNGCEPPDLPLSLTHLEEKEE